MKMRSSTLSATAAILSALKLVSGQTFTDCNPLTSTSCPPDPALGTTITTDFTKGASSDWSLEAGTTLSYGSNGAEFTINTATEAPTISSNKYIFFGKVSVTTQAAPGTGIVSSFILLSDDLDEIDWEWLGSTDSSVESNFFGKGNTTTYNRAVYQNVATPIQTFHTYTIDWTSSAIQWIIDGVTVRTLPFDDPLALGGRNYPQTPMRVKMGNWVGCASVAAETNPATAGTCSWAGGAATFGGNTAYTMFVSSVTIEDYSCGSQYTYGDESGSWQSIQISDPCAATTPSPPPATTPDSSPDTTPSSTPANAVSPTSAATAWSTTSAAVFAETSSSALSSVKAIVTASGNTTSATTLSTVAGTTASTTAGSTSANTSSSRTSSSTPAQVTSSDGTTLKPKHRYGVLDFGVIALGLGLGYLVM